MDGRVGVIGSGPEVAGTGGPVPQTPWDLSLCACSSKVTKEEGGPFPARPTLLVASPQIGAQVASLRCPIFRPVEQIWGLSRAMSR